MDELKHKAGVKLEAIQEAAKTVADNGKTKVQEVVHQSAETIRKIHAAFVEVWHHELIAESRQRCVAWSRETIQRIKDGAPPLSPVLLYEEIVAMFKDREVWHHKLIAESRQRCVAWSRETIQRIKDGAPPLSPVLLYEEIVAMFKDRVWRRSMVIFLCGVLVGGVAGVAGSAGWRRGAGGPHARALYHLHDGSVSLVEDAVAPGAGHGEVLVRVQCFSVTPVDRAVLRGRGAALRSLLTRSSITVGRGFSGVVLDIGQGVTELELGDEVWGCVTEWSGGAASELLTVRSTRVSKRPRSVSADSAASLPWAGSIALGALDRLKFTPDSCKGKRVAICGAGSGEGCVLVQLLGAWGAHVSVTAPRHALLTLQDLGASELIEVDGTEAAVSWSSLEKEASRRGPWDAVVACLGVEAPHDSCDNPQALLRATAPRNAVLDLRPTQFISDRLPGPFSLLFAASFYTFRVLRWLTGCGMHTDWLEEHTRLTAGMTALAGLVDAGVVAPVLDKVYLPQDYENALAHACSDEAIGTTVIRFP